MRWMLAVVFYLGLAAPGFAQEVNISASDTTQSVLAAQKGKRVTLRLGSGQELTGTVREATTTLIVLGGISGREFFDAVIPVGAVEAVLIRMK